MIFPLPTLYKRDTNGNIEKDTHGNIKNIHGTLRNAPGNTEKHFRKH